MKIFVKMGLKTSLSFAFCEARMFAAPLYVRKGTIEWLNYGDTSVKEAFAVYVNGMYCTHIESLDALRGYEPLNEPAAWTQVGNLVYIRYSLGREIERTTRPSAGDWWFRLKSASHAIGFTDGNFIFGGSNISYRSAILSGYTKKESAEIGNYSVMKFENSSITFLRSVIGDNYLDFIGQPLEVYDEEERKLDMMLVNDAEFDRETVRYELKDIRSIFTDKIIDQKFNREEYKSKNRDSYLMSEATGKKYKQDAIGYCVGVPGVIVNDYAFDGGNDYFEADSRYVRFSYGSINIEKIEIEGDQGWFELPKDKYRKSDSFSETLPNGSFIDSYYIVVSVMVLNPPPPTVGVGEPDYGGTGRRIRATGFFHTEISGIDRAYQMFKYLIDRYASMQFIKSWFNVEEISNELNDEPGIGGILFETPIDLYNGIAKLQNGFTAGFQLLVYNGLITARRAVPAGSASAYISYYEIVNINSLKVKINAKEYTSNLIIEYAENYSESVSSEFTDLSVTQDIIDKKILARTKRIETLLKNEDQAKDRFNEEIASSKEYAPIIEGVKLTNFEKYRYIRIFDRVWIDFGELTDIREWIVTNVAIDYHTEDITLSVYKNLNE